MPKKTEKKSVFKIKKKFMVGLASWLNKLALQGRESRYRTRFVTTVAGAVDLLEKERLEIIEKYVNKEIGANGKEIWKKTVDNSGERWDVDGDKEELLKNEVNDLYEEDYIIEVNEENRAIIACIRDKVLNTDYIFGPSQNDNPVIAQRKMAEANEYNVWCEAFEALEI